MAATLREKCSKRLAGLRTLRQPYEAEWREIAGLAQPARTRWLNADTNKNSRQRNTKLRDGHGIWSMRTLTAGMMSGLSSPSRPWFMLASQDEAMMDEPAVKEWLTVVEQRMYGFLAGTNFYGAAKAGYAELALFGTEACVMVENQTHGAVCHALTAGEYWVATSDAAVVDTLYRRVPMTVVQAMQTFGRDAVSTRVRNAYDRSAYEDTVDVIHAIEPRYGRDPSKLDKKNKPWRSVWWDENDGADKLLLESGYDEQPFWAPRWDVVGADAWGQSPGMEALPDLRELQAQVRLKGEATDWLIKPEKVTSPSLKLKNMPGAITAAASVDQSTVLVPYQVPYQAIAVIGEDIAKCKEAVDRATYAELFMAITNMQGVQPRNVEEIASRNEEKLTQLGPVIERVNNEKLEVAIDRTFGIMLRGGFFPPPPEEIAGSDLKIEFISILTQMQRMVGIGQIERTAGFIGNLMGAFPDAGDKFNTDEAIDDYARRAGTPPKLIRSDDEVAEIRQNRAQAMQAEKAAAMMPAVQQGADAARLLSETDVGGQSMLQSMMQ